MSITVFVALQHFTRLLDASSSVQDLYTSDYAITNEMSIGGFTVLAASMAEFSSAVLFVMNRSGLRIPVAAINTPIQYNWILLDAMGISYDEAAGSDIGTGFSFMAIACKSPSRQSWQNSLILAVIRP